MILKTKLVENLMKFLSNIDIIFFRQTKGILHIINEMILKVDSLPQKHNQRRSPLARINNPTQKRGKTCNRRLLFTPRTDSPCTNKKSFACASGPSLQYCSPFPKVLSPKPCTYVLKKKRKTKSDATGISLFEIWSQTNSVKSSGKI